MTSPWVPGLLFLLWDPGETNRHSLVFFSSLCFLSISPPALPSLPKHPHEFCPQIMGVKDDGQIPLPESERMNTHRRSPPARSKCPLNPESQSLLHLQEREGSYLIAEGAMPPAPVRLLSWTGMLSSGSHPTRIMRSLTHYLCRMGQRWGGVVLLRAGIIAEDG